ncbi:hypothetical protein [Bacillus massilinigeriensis]|uniref:hypothetical protein n=1 Tax=Bacillus mediterraneensis TaxID=1805474 RepID=UPI0008F91F37|nr:hypothetical protein [Bacillus mediterraneensis]
MTKLRVLLVLLATGISLAGIIFFSLLPDKFDQEKWLKNPDKRVDMVDHLLAEENLKGMTKAEIVDLLGKVEENAYYKEPNNIVYYLGPERGFIRIDSEWLVIWLDDKEKVTDYEISRD